MPLPHKKRESEPPHWSSLNLSWASCLTWVQLANSSTHLLLMQNYIVQLDRLHYEEVLFDLNSFRFSWKRKLFLSCFCSMPYMSCEILDGQKLPPNCSALDDHLDTGNNGPNLENLGKCTILAISNPCGNILGIWSYWRCHNESYPIPLQFHPWYHGFEGTTAGFI